MKDITNNEMQIILGIFKSPEQEYNANSLSKIIKISPMGTLKILKRLEKEEILIPKELGKAVFYSINFKNPYSKEYINFLLKREANNYPNVETKIWIQEIRQKIKSADITILFGSVLRNGKEAKDIDVVFVTDQKKLEKLKKEIENVNILHNKKIHPTFQSENDFKNNIKELDKPLLSALKGIVVFGEEKLIEVLER